VRFKETVNINQVCCGCCCQMQGLMTVPQSTVSAMSLSAHSSSCTRGSTAHYSCRISCQDLRPWVFSIWHLRSGPTCSPWVVPFHLACL
jgi:DNA-binding transcriptional regulator YdaS (Cro superfamily)